MGKIYVGQSDLTIKLETGKDLTGIATAEIIYRNPAGITGNFTATISDVIKGIIEYSVTSEKDLNIAGKWTFWAKTIDAQGLISIGEPSTYHVNKEGY
jgi:hypothetical protein